MDAARLPEVFDFDGLRVRVFPASSVTENLPHATRRSIPAVVRRLFKGAATHAVEEAPCSICGASAPTEGRVLIAVETADGHDIGCICAACGGEFQVP
jgi:hypothetical protein